MKGLPYIYLDYAGSGIVRETVMASYAEYASRYSINPHGGTCQAEKCHSALMEAEIRLLRCLGIRQGEAHVVWTSGGTEALNLAIRGWGGAENTVFVDPTAHPAMLQPSLTYGDCKQLPVDGGGQVKFPGQVEKPPQLVGICHVNNESGCVQKLVELRSWMNTFGDKPVCLVVDAAQSFGRVEIPWRSAHIDMLSISSRKIGGPASVGALVVRHGVHLKPILLGGGQQGGLRSGTVDTVGVLMFVDAAEEACAEREAEAARIKILNQTLWEGLSAMGQPSFKRLSPPAAVPAIACFAFTGYEGAVLKRMLAEREGIVVGTGSACSAESGKPSHVLTAMGVDSQTIRGALRVSFGSRSTLDEVQALLTALKRTLDNY